MNKQIIIGIIIGLLFASFIIGIYFGYENTKDKFYNRGVFEGQAYIIQSIQSTGNLPFFSNETGNLTIKYVSIKDICKSGQ